MLITFSPIRFSAESGQTPGSLLLVSVQAIIWKIKSREQDRVTLRTLKSISCLQVMCLSLVFGNNEPVELPFGVPTSTSTNTIVPSHL